LAPKPWQKPTPPIRIAATSPDTYPAIGALGHAAFVAARTGTISELALLVRSYREAHKAAGHPGEGEVYLRVPVYVAETGNCATSSASTAFWRSSTPAASSPIGW
jgi:alkanesulfonate monooxygenase SsuD/methylene tetrahydromethanopterin reductase-like flavin-dependent oxidoreductase (luciferase family)